jgi:hypothetical protein
MPSDVPRAPLYRGVINLWVEDALTREYLAAVWRNDPDVAFLVGGGNEGIRGVVHHAKAAGYRNVFGVTDRDFRPSNRAAWDDPQKTFRTFVLPVHEIENYLLDADALHSSRLQNTGLPVGEIEVRMRAAAQRLCWWAACREVVAELKRRFREPFVADPACTLSGLDQAQAHICESPWFRKLDQEVARSTTEDVGRLLQEGHRQAEWRLADGTWRSEFAGKEIFRDVGSRICDRRKLAMAMTPTDFDTNLAKDVADWQVQQNRVPQDLLELLRALRDRIGRA